MEQFETPSGSSPSLGKGHIAALVVFVSLILFVVTRSGSPNTPSGRAARDAEAAYARIAQLSALLDAASDAETGARGFVITGDAGFLAPYEGALALETAEMEELTALYAGSREAATVLQDLRDAFDTRREHMSSAVNLRRRTLGADQAARVLADFRGQELTDVVRAELNGLMREEQAVLAGVRNQKAFASSAGGRVLFVVGGVSLVVLSFGFVAFARARRRQQVPAQDSIAR